MRHTIIADSIQDRGYPVHFRQGDLDGACGLYSLMMCLNLCGCVDDEISFANEPDRRTQLGRLYKQFADFPALFSGGCSLTDLQEAIARAYGRRHISTEYCEGNNRTILKFAVKHILAGHPVIFGISGSGGLEHALTASGLEFEYDNGETPDLSGITPDKILMLDPGGCEVPPFIHWNCFVYYGLQYKGRFPYQFVRGSGETHKICFDGALAIWSKKKGKDFS